MRSVFSAIDSLEASIWGYFLEKTSGLERNRILGIVRVVSLPITLFSAVIAGLLSHVYGSFDLKLFAVCTVGLLLAHSASNVMNDLWDYRSGLDSQGYFRNVYGVHAVHALGEKGALFIGLLLSFTAFLCGLYLFVHRGVWVLVLAVLGFVLLVSYSGPPFRFKYIGLGELVVFLVWGPLMIGGGFYVISGSVGWEALVASVPYGITASLVLFGKHLDKLEQDRERGVNTLPVILGERRTKIICKVLLYLPYPFVILLSLLSREYGLILTLLSLPRVRKAVTLLSMPKPSSVDAVPSFYPKKFWPMWYVGGAFIVNVDFAITYILGLLTSSLIN